MDRRGNAVSNYPPGVTGRELQIAGPDWEGSVQRECTQEDVLVQVIKDPAETKRSLETLADVVKYGVATRPSAAMAYERLKRNIVVAELPKCPFSGQVDAWTYRESLRWTCPTCGHEYDEYLDDYDSGYDE